MNRVDLLLYHGITPYVVFDGADLPAKAATESDRQAYVCGNMSRDSFDRSYVSPLGLGHGNRIERLQKSYWLRGNDKKPKSIVLVQQT